MKFKKGDKIRITTDKKSLTYNSVLPSRFSGRVTMIKTIFEKKEKTYLISDPDEDMHGRMAQSAWVIKEKDIERLEKLNWKKRLEVQQ